MRIMKKPEERKAEMVSAAADLFSQKGFNQTSVAEIATAVDVAKGLFYYYFSTKDDMVKAVVDVFCTGLGQIADGIAGADGTVEEKITKLMMHSAWEKCFTAPLMEDLCGNLALYAYMCDAMSDHLTPALESIMIQAMKEKEIKKDVKTTVGITLYGLLMMARRGNITHEQAVDVVRNMLK